MGRHSPSEEHKNQHDEEERRNEPRAKRRTSFFFLARFQILQVMFSSRVFFSCGLRIALACARARRTHHRTSTRIDQHMPRIASEDRT